MNSSTHDGLLRALQVAVNRDRHARRRRRRVAIATLPVVLAGAAVAAATTPPWWARSKPERSKAVILVQATLRYNNFGLAAGSKIALWRAPDQAGGTCLLLGALSAGVPQRAGLCEQHGGKPVYASGKPIDPMSSSYLSHGVYDHIVAGSIDPTSGIVKVVLQQPTSWRTLAFSHGWFIGDTAPTTTLAVPNAYLVGYDRLGHEVARAPVWKQGR